MMIFERSCCCFSFIHWSQMKWWVSFTISEDRKAKLRKHRQKIHIEMTTAAVSTLFWRNFTCGFKKVQVLSSILTCCTLSFLCSGHSLDMMKLGYSVSPSVELVKCPLHFYFWCPCIAVPLVSLVPLEHHSQVHIQD
jgi:hypothetical protein